MFINLGKTVIISVPTINSLLMPPSFIYVTEAVKLARLASSFLIGILLLSQKPFTFKPNKWILTAGRSSLQPLLSLHSSYWVKTWNFASTSNKLKLQVTVGNSRKLSFTLNEYFDSTFNIQHSERMKRNAELEINFYWIWNVLYWNVCRN